MNWSWDVLTGARLTVAPTTLEDAAELAACADAETFQFSLGGPATTSVEDMARFLAGKESMPYTMRLAETGEAVGCSSFMDLRPAHRALEIGSTWIAPAWRGTFVNPEVKLLMMTHAFETLDCVRVQLKCDARNARSAAAIAKLGVVPEGRLRNYGIMRDGFVRDTLMFSVTDAEWPEVRDRLKNRLLGLT